MLLLYANAATLQTPQVGGHHRHIGVIMKLAIYTIIYTTSWKNPPDPGVYPTVPKNIPTDQKYQLQLHHKEGQRIYDNTARMDKALNNQVIQSVEDRYLKELKNKQIGFLGVM